MDSTWTDEDEAKDSHWVDRKDDDRDHYFLQTSIVPRDDAHYLMVSC